VPWRSTLEGTLPALYVRGFDVVVDGDQSGVAALWDRATDSHADTREEAICGLARRRDPRAIALMAGLLSAPDGARILVFGAAAVLGAAELLPVLELYDPADPGVADAIAECDPVARDAREQLAWELLSGSAVLLPSEARRMVFGGRTARGRCRR
jgi:hypothetical protein